MFFLINSFFFFLQPNPFRISFFVLISKCWYIFSLDLMHYLPENIKNIVFWMPFLLMSPLYDVIISNIKILKSLNPYKMRMHYPIRILLVPLNFILQGLSDKDKNKYVIWLVASTEIGWSIKMICLKFALINVTKNVLFGEFALISCRVNFMPR